MHRFYCDSKDISSNKIIIFNRRGVHYLSNVLRLRVGNELIMFDATGNEYYSILESLLPENIIFKIKQRYKFVPSKIPEITVACAIPKKSKMDDIVDKLTQLGARRIIPLLTKRVIVSLDRNKKISRQKRWERIALSAAQQSQRNTVSIVDYVKDIKEVLSQSQDFDLKLFPTLTDESSVVSKRRVLREIFSRMRPKNILVLIGPEGDFTLQELELAKKSGCIPVSLGELVLRVDTASIAIVSYIKLALL